MKKIVATNRINGKQVIATLRERPVVTPKRKSHMKPKTPGSRYV